MISEDWPNTCCGESCIGRSVPATWKYVSNKWGTAYYCTKHARFRGEYQENNLGKWVPLTPNQRPVSVKE